MRFLRHAERQTLDESGLRTLTWCATVALACAACGAPQKAAADNRSIVVARSGENTVVSIDDSPDPESAVCIEYCRRLSACWYAMPNRREEMSEVEVTRACLKDESNCRTPTTETLCCGKITDCQDFVRCQERSHDVVSDCSRSFERR